jgi:hypothetical protein
MLALSLLAELSPASFLSEPVDWVASRKPSASRISVSVPLTCRTVQSYSENSSGRYADLLGNVTDHRLG